MKWQDKLAVVFLAFAIGVGIGSILTLIPSTMVRIGTVIIIIGIILASKGIENFITTGGSKEPSHNVDKKDK